MEKYYRVPKSYDNDTEPNEVRIGGIHSQVSRSIEYGLNLLRNQENPRDSIIVKAIGSKMISKAIFTAEIIKLRVPGLHQITEIGTTDVVTQYMPKEEGLEKVELAKKSAFIKITLSKVPLDTTNPGYQPPNDESKQKEIRSVSNSFRGSGRGGRGSYRGGLRRRGGYRGGRGGALSRRGGPRRGGRGGSFRGGLRRGGRGGSFRGTRGGRRGGFRSTTSTSLTRKTENVDLSGITIDENNNNNNDNNDNNNNTSPTTATSTMPGGESTESYRGRSGGYRRGYSRGRGGYRGGYRRGGSRGGRGGRRSSPQTLLPTTTTTTTTVPESTTSPTTTTTTN